MLTTDELQEYLDEIRQEVCTCCPERPEGGPPCGPLGKPCGVEMHLPQLIDSIHQAPSEWLGPYVERNRQRICPSCPFHGDSYHCPCPMESLAALLIPAVESVDQKREARERQLQHMIELWGE